MPEPNPESVEALFQQALDLAPDRRRAFLAEQCAGDPELLRAVEELLHFDAKAQSTPEFLHSPAANTRAVLSTSERAMPASIGRFRVIRRLGEGGMGTVYEAEQDDPRRRVALKVLRPGLDSAEGRKRFAQEARILARLHHSGIAQVFEAGSTEDGRLYLAMEFVSGSPLTEYARLQGLTASARLELMARVCDAVQHAHEQEIVHRDLKPANILVDETGQPKVVDFGVAHATGAGILDTSAHTRTGQIIGTLGYMSPEQVAGDPRSVDVRSDVYALGVILYELLADRLPYQLDRLPIPEVIRVIQEVEPSRLGSVNREFRGEIETIVAKALEKDKGRRYPAAGHLGEDLRRHLSHEPILARPASALYKMQRFVRRHKQLVAGTLAVFAALVAATIISLFSAREARQSAKMARSETYRAQIAAAVAALATNDVADAARHLDRAPQELRGWEWRHLYGRLDDACEVSRVHASDHVLLLPDQESLRFGIVSDTGLRFRDESGKESPQLALPNLTKVQFSLVGPATDWLLATAETKHLVTLRDENGRLVREIQPPGETAFSIMLSPDRTRLAIPVLAENKLPIHIYDTSSGEMLATCAGHQAPILALTFSPDSRRLATGGDDRVVRIWDVATGKQLTECEGHTSKVLSIAFRGDGLRLLTASHDRTVRQWDVQTGREAEPPYDHHTADVYVAVYSPDGQRIASGGSDRTTRLWWASGRQDQAVLRGHTGDLSALAFEQDGRRLVSASYNLPGSQGDGTMRFWEADPEATLPILAGHTSYVYPVSYSPDGRWIASGAWDNRVRIWDAATGEPSARLNHSDIVRVLGFTPDSTRVITGGDFAEVRIWNIATGDIEGRIAVDESVRSLAVNHDGSRVAVGTYDPEAGNTMRIFGIEPWMIRSSQRMAVGDQASDFRLVSAVVPGLPFAFSPDGKLLAGRDADGNNVVLWDPDTLRPVARWEGHTGEINAVAFDRAGGRLVSASSDHTVRLWETATGRCLRIFEGHTDVVFAVTWHPDGTRIASAGRDRAIWLWDPASAQEVARLPGHSSYIWSLAFSPDGETLISGSGDFTVRLWDTSPLAKRYQARREVESLKPAAERLVERLFAESRQPADVVARLRTDETLNNAMRQAALRVLMRRSEQERP